MTIQGIIDNFYQEDILGVTSWCEDKFNKLFASSFQKVDELYRAMESKSQPITTEQLEWALTEFPLDLYVVAENVSQLKLEAEVIKLKNKQLKKDLTDNYRDVAKGSELTEHVNYKMIENEIVLAAYNSLIARVESKLAYSREFIMGAKKIWDARVKTTTVNPISEVNAEDLPEYPKYYIK